MIQSGGVARTSTGSVTIGKSLYEPPAGQKVTVIRGGTGAVENSISSASKVSILKPEGSGSFSGLRPELIADMNASSVHTSQVFEYLPQFVETAAPTLRAEAEGLKKILNPKFLEGLTRDLHNPVIGKLPKSLQEALDKGAEATAQWAKVALPEAKSAIVQKAKDLEQLATELESLSAKAQAVASSKPTAGQTQAEVWINSLGSEMNAYRSIVYQEGSLSLIKPDWNATRTDLFKSVLDRTKQVMDGHLGEFAVPVKPPVTESLRTYWGVPNPDAGYLSGGPAPILTDLRAWMKYN
jgi:hypothetical protein